MVSSINVFTIKLKLLKSQVTNKNFNHFPCTRLHLETAATFDTNRYIDDFQKITGNFQDRFSDFTAIIGRSTLISNTFMNLNVQDTASQIALSKLDKSVRSVGNGNYYFAK